MANYARIISDVAVDVSSNPAEEFHPSIAAEFEPVPDNVENNWRRNPQTGGWSAPEVAQEQPGQATVPLKVGPLAFKLLFSAPERVKAKQLRSTDDFIEDFWGLLDDPRTDVVDMALGSVQAAVEYTLTAVKAAGVELDIPTRKAEILAGQMR